MSGSFGRLNDVAAASTAAAHSSAAAAAYPPPAASRSARASYANSDLSSVGGAVHAQAGVAAAAPRRGLLGIIDRRKEVKAEKAAVSAFGVELLGVMKITDAVADGIDTKAIAKVIGSAHRAAVIQMVTQFLAGTVDREVSGSRYSVNDFQTRKSILLSGFVDPRHCLDLVNVASVRPEVTLGNAENNAERALVLAALDSGNGLSGLYGLTGLDKLIDGIFGKRDHEVKLCLEYNMRSQLVRDVLWQPGKVGELYAVLPPVQSKSPELQSMIIGPLQERYATANGPDAPAAKRNKQTAHLAELESVLKPELLGLIGGQVSIFDKYIGCLTNMTRHEDWISSLLYKVFNDVLHTVTPPVENRRIRDEAWKAIGSFLLNPDKTIENIKVKMGITADSGSGSWLAGT
jgi:hypothetical protein